MFMKLANLAFVAMFSLSVLSCSKTGGSEPTPAVVPSVKIQDATQERTTTASVMHVTVTLDKTTTEPVSVDYSFTDGTAKSPKDYTGTPGTLTIAAGRASAEITVPVSADPTNTRADHLEFTISLSNPKGCRLSTSTAKGIITAQNGTNFVTGNSGYSTPLTYPGMNLVWSDEFDGSALNTSDWNYETGNGAGGWGNNELQYYTNTTKNVFVSNGNLIIEARKEGMGGFDYTSARITTQNKKSFTFGRVDIRAKLPKTKGVWPALWMLGNNISSVGWPASGEIDIMELLGQEPAKVYATLHYGANTAAHASKGNSLTLSSGNFSDQFHVFSMDWKQDEIKMFVDDQVYLTVNKADLGTNPYPFNDPFFFIFNVAVGGNWPGSPDAGTVLPQRMIVDYIRVFQ